MHEDRVMRLTAELSAAKAEYDVYVRESLRREQADCADWRLRLEAESELLAIVNLRRQMLRAVTRDKRRAQRAARVAAVLRIFGVQKRKP